MNTMYESSTPDLLADMTGDVLRLTLNRPDQSNALTYDMIATALELVRRAGEDWDVRVVVIDGAGDDFCIGDDPDDMGKWPESHSHRHPGGAHGPGPILHQELFKAIRALPKPVVSLIRGSALDAGLDLVCVTDIRLAADDAVLADTRVLKAQHAATGLTYILPRLIGQSRAMGMLLAGETLGGKEAEGIGLAYKAFDPDIFVEESEAIIADLAAMPTRSYALIKQQIIDQLDMPYPTALMHSLAVRQTNVIEDIGEGMSAFREKRKPEFKGR